MLSYSFIQLLLVTLRYLIVIIAIRSFILSVELYLLFLELEIIWRLEIIRTYDLL